MLRSLRVNERFRWSATEVAQSTEGVPGIPPETDGAMPLLPCAVGYGDLNRWPCVFRVSSVVPEAYKATISRME